MMSIDVRMKHAQDDFLDQFGSVFELREFSASNGDFGDLKGLEFDSDRCGGYLHFWSSGVIEYHLIDYKVGDEVLPFAMRTEATEAGANAVVSEFFRVIANVVWTTG